MTEWAERAGKLVFQEAEDMHEDSIVSYVNLALFWHSQGSWRISYLHKGRRAFRMPKSRFKVSQQPLAT